MKILILNASPRWHGNISQMLETIKSTAEEHGAEVTYREVNHLKVHPCIACMKCRTTKKCVLPEDDAQNILNLIKESDALVMGSPCYWGNMTGQMKLLFDRMVYGLMDENEHSYPVPLHKGKRCILLSASSTPWPFNKLMNQSHGAIRAMKEICKYSGFDIMATIEKGGTRRSQTLTEREIRKCKKVTMKLVSNN